MRWYMRACPVCAGDVFEDLADEGRATCLMCGRELPLAAIARQPRLSWGETAWFWRPWGGQPGAVSPKSLDLRTPSAAAPSPPPIVTTSGPPDGPGCHEVPRLGGRESTTPSRRATPPVGSGSERPALHIVIPESHAVRSGP